MYKTETAKPPMVKYYRYFMLFLVTCFSLCFCCHNTSNTYSFGEFVEDFYYRTSVKNNFNPVTARNIGENNIDIAEVNVTEANFTESDGIVVFSEVEDTEENIFASMTKSEIYDYQRVLRENLVEWENNQNTETQSCSVNFAYLDLTEQLEESEIALSSGNYLYPYSQKDLDIVAYVIYREAGSRWLTNRHRDLVGCVVRNRRNQGGINQNLTNPSYADILNEEGQYPYKSWDVDTSVIPDYCYKSAIRVLEYKVECPDNIVWQATFKQGSETYEKFYDKTLDTTTYFCKR